MDRDWRYAEAKRDGLNYFIRARSLPSDDLPPKGFSHLVVVTWNFPHGPEGIPLDEQAVKAMESFEDILDRGVVEHGIAVLASCLTGGGKKVWEYYTTDTDDFMKALRECLAGQARFPIQLDTRLDPNWDSLRKLNSALVAG